MWPELAEGYVPLQDEDVRKGLALFVALMHLRNPAVREEVERIHGQIVALHETASLRADGTPDIQEVEIDGQGGLGNSGPSIQMLISLPKKLQPLFRRPAHLKTGS